MKIQISDRWSGLDGLVFLPVKPVDGKVPTALPMFKNLPISKAEWNSETEGCWNLDGVSIVKTAPVTQNGNTTSWAFAEAIGKALRTLSTRGVKRAGVFLPALDEVGEASLMAILQVPDLLTYDLAPYKSKDDAKKLFSIREIVFVTPDKKVRALLEKALDKARVIAGAVNVARMLADEPANSLTPQKFAAAALAQKSSRLSVKKLDNAVLKKMGGVQSVCAGSQHQPEFVIMELNPKAKGRPVVIIGKGVTFDTGGISIKPADLMWEMKGDMAGGAAIIGAMKALDGLGCQKRVIGLVPMVENMPDGKSVKPGDVITHFDGQTTEVLNTDAEGRLILADALAYAQQFNPLWTIDLATLTGAIVVALGSRFTGMFCNAPNLQDSLQKAAAASGDLIWPMPLHPSFVEEMKSSFADWKNLGNRKGGACTAAGFLSAFAKGDWAHLDIAGTAEAEKENPWTNKSGATGVGVRLLASLING